MKNFETDFCFMSDEDILSRASSVDYPRKEVINCAVRTLGEVSTLKEICDFFKISKTHLYRGINERKILTVKSGARLLILTKTLANILDNNDV